MSDLEPLLRRVIGARVRDAATVEDLVQETLVRILVVDHRLDESSLRAYAVVTAQNLVRSLARSEERRRRLLPRLFDPRQPEDPADRATEHEERRALTDALAQLPARDRDVLIAHHVEGVDTATLGRQLGGSAGAVSVRLARARGRLRVEYLLARHPTQLPTSSCKPVLLALSNGDQRRQQALNAGKHLLTCRSCAELSEPLVQRRRPWAVAWPAALLGPLAARLGRAVRSHPLRTSAAAAVVAAAVVAANLLVGLDPQPAPALILQDDPSVALAGDKPLAPYADQQVSARKVTVFSAPGDEGFWVGGSAVTRIWVNLESGEPLAQRVAAGQRVSFVGTMVRNQTSVLEASEVGSPPDREQLERQGSHVHLDEATLVIEGRPAPRPP